MRRTIRNISLATRLALVALVVTLLSLAVTATVGLVRGSELTEDVVDSRLVAIAGSRASAVEVDINSLRRELAATASSPATADAIRELSAALFELAETDISSSTAENVADYYLSEVVPGLEAVRGPGAAGVASLIPTGSAALSLQDAYTIQEPTEEGNLVAPNLVVDAGDGSTYSELHPEVHRTWSAIALESQLDDVFLIEADTGSIVYTYRKRIDFATSLNLGPHSGSSLARGVDLVSRDADREPLLSPLTRYTPAYDQPTAFIIAPVADGTELVGFVAYSFSFERLDGILAGPDRWAAFGNSGEAFIADAGATMITTARTLEDDRVGFREQSTEPGPGQLTDAQRTRIAETGTTATVQKVPADAVAAATTEPSVTDTANYRGDAVRSVTTRLNVDGVTWTLFVEAETEELDVVIEQYARDMLIAVALFVVAITFVAVRWSNRLVAPVRAIATRLRRTRSMAARAGDPLTGVESVLLESRPGAPTEAEAAAADEALIDSGPEEFVELSDTVDVMIDRLADRRAAVAARSRERTALLQQFLPAAIARRSEEANAEVLDYVRQASVAVIMIDGIGALLGDQADQDIRDLLAEVLDEVDAVAADSGVERVKLAGSTYYAVCGAGRPLLDHAPRTVGFALRVRDVVNEATEGRLSVRVGVAEGPVSVGLAERSAMIYDVWGDTVALAEELAGEAPSDTVLVSDVVASHLPEVFVTAGDAGEGRSVVTGRVAEVSNGGGA